MENRSLAVFIDLYLYIFPLNKLSPETVDSISFSQESKLPAVLFIHQYIKC